MDKSEYVVSADGYIYWEGDLYRPITGVGVIEYELFDFCSGPHFMSREALEVNKFNN